MWITKNFKQNKWILGIQQKLQQTNTITNTENTNQVEICFLQHKLMNWKHWERRETYCGSGKLTRCSPPATWRSPTSAAPLTFRAIWVELIRRRCWNLNLCIWSSLSLGPPWSSFNCGGRVPMAVSLGRSGPW